MKRFLTAVVLWLAAASAAFGQVPYFPQTLQGHTVVGRLSSTAGPTEAIPFATLATALGQTSPTLNATTCGVVADDATDNATALATCITQLTASGRSGVLVLPQGSIRTSSFPNLSANNITIQGQGDYATGTVLRYTGTTGNFITVTGQHVYLKNIYFKPVNRMTSGYQIVFDSGGFVSGVDHVRIDYAYDGIFVRDNTEFRISNFQNRYLLGVNGLYVTGTVSVGTFGGHISDYIANNPYPGAYSTIKSWSTSTAYSLNDIVTVNGRVYQCTSAGTSANSGTGPSGLPSGTTPDSSFTGTITDGGVLWKFVATQGLAWLTMDNYANSVRITNSALINGDVAFRMLDTAATGTSYPQWVFIDNLETDHSYSNGIQLTKGYGFYATNSWFGSALTGSGVLWASTYTGEASLTTSRIMGNWKYGVEVLGTGSLDLILDANFISSNSAAGSGSFDGVKIAANATRFVITNNRLGTALDTASNNQNWGVNILAGTSDYYTVTGNVVIGQVAGGVTDNGTGTHKTVAFNAATPDLLQSINQLTTGMVANTGSGVAAARTITGTSNQITVTNGNGVSGNPTISIPNPLSLTGQVLNVNDGADFQILNIADATKVVRFSLASLTTGNTRTWTFPDGTDTFAGLGQTQTFSGVNTFSNTTDSTTTATGAIVTSGGLGVAKAGVLGTSLTVGGGTQLSNVRLNLNGTQTSANIAFGLYTGSLTLSPASGNNAYFQYAGGGTVNTGGGTSTIAAAYYGAAIVKAGGGTITNAVGMYLEAQTVGTNNYTASFQDKFQVAGGGIAANGSVATAMSSLGPAGSHTTIQEWLVVVNGAGVTRWIPMF